MTLLQKDQSSLLSSAKFRPMKKLLFLFLSALPLFSLFAQAIQVDASNVIRTLDHNPAAINVNYLMDDDSYLNPAIPVAQALSQMSIGRLRYPGGEKSDNYLWSVPPYSQVAPHFATPGNCNWPNDQATFSSDFITPLPT